MLSTDPKSPYEAGYDAGFRKPDGRNCHHRWFDTEEHTREWERGKEEGQKAKAEGQCR